MRKITALALFFLSCGASAQPLDYLDATQSLDGFDDDLSFHPQDNQPAIFEPILESIFAGVVYGASVKNTILYQNTNQNALPNYAPILPATKDK